MLSRRLRRRVRALTVSAAGGLALVGVASAAASAGAACPPVTVTGGTGTIFMTKSYIANMAAHNIVMTAQNPISVTSQDTYTTTIWTVTGGNADLRSCTGIVQFGGGTLVTNTATGQSLLLTDIRYNVATDAIDYTLQTPNGPLTIQAMDLAGTQRGQVKGRTGTYSASELFIDPAAGSALDSALGTTAFLDTGVFGALTTTFTLSQGASTHGPAVC